MNDAPHLIARFFDVLTARPLRPAEQAFVERLLHADAERDMFWRQPRADQRHGVAAARHVEGLAPDRTDLMRAALLHDTGKRHAGLSVIGRVLASLVRLLGRPGSGRISVYLDHGPIAADELTAAGAEHIVIDYARHHHGSRPASIDGDEWAVLDAADRARR